jgi:hypothetical protein
MNFNNDNGFLNAFCFGLINADSNSNNFKTAILSGFNDNLDIILSTNFGAVQGEKYIIYIEARHKNSNPSPQEDFEIADLITSGITRQKKGLFIYTMGEPTNLILQGSNCLVNVQKIN